MTNQVLLGGDITSVPVAHLTHSCKKQNSPPLKAPTPLALAAVFNVHPESIVCLHLKKRLSLLGLHGKLFLQLSGPSQDVHRLSLVSAKANTYNQDSVRQPGGHSRDTKLHNNPTTLETPPTRERSLLALCALLRNSACRVTQG